MGRATILSGGIDGLYSVQLDFGQATKTANLARLADQLVALATQISDAEGAVAVADVLASMARDKVLATIDAYVAASRVEPPDTAAIKTALDAYTQAQKDLLTEQTKGAPARLRLQLLQAQQAAARKAQAYWQALVLVETRPAWCADLTVDASGSVATIDIPGESALCLVAPSAPAPTAADGALLAREVQTGPQAFFNAAVLPGWQKFKPTYRRGVITALDTEADTADVTLFAGDTSSAQALPINQSATLSGVPVQYMTCHAKAFAVDDAVVVKFTGQDWATPKVVGFVSHPKPCQQQRVWVLVTLYDQYTGFTHYTEPRIDELLVPNIQNVGTLSASVIGSMPVTIAGGGFGSGQMSVSAASCLYRLAHKDLNETRATRLHSGSSTRTAHRTYVENLNTDGDASSPYDTHRDSSYNNTFGKLSGFIGVDGVAVMWSHTLSAALDKTQNQGGTLLQELYATADATTDIRWTDGLPGGVYGSQTITAHSQGGSQQWQGPFTLNTGYLGGSPTQTIVGPFRYDAIPTYPPLVEGPPGAWSGSWLTSAPGGGIFYEAFGTAVTGALVHKPPAFYEMTAPPRYSVLLNNPAASYLVSDKYSWQETNLQTLATGTDANGLPYPRAGGAIYATPFISLPTPAYSVRWMDLAGIEYAYQHDGYGSLYRYNGNSKVIGRDWQAYSAQYGPPYDDAALYAGEITDNFGSTITTFRATYMPISKAHGFFVDGSARPLRYGAVDTADANIHNLPALDLRLLPDLPTDMLDVIENGSPWVVDTGFAATSVRAHNTVNTFWGTKQITVTLLADAKDILEPDVVWDLHNSRTP